MIHHRTHPTYVDGCFTCKALSVSFGTVPGGSRDERIGASANRQWDKDLHRYREKRRAGEQPDGTTKKAMDRSERKQDIFERREQDLVDQNPPEVVAQAKKALTNKV